MKRFQTPYRTSHALCGDEKKSCVCVGHSPLQRMFLQRHICTRAHEMPIVKTLTCYQYTPSLNSIPNISCMLSAITTMRRLQDSLCQNLLYLYSNSDKLEFSLSISRSLPSVFSIVRFSEISVVMFCRQKDK